MSLAPEETNGPVPRSMIAPLSHKTACDTFRGEEKDNEPTICPRLLMATAELLALANVPRSVIIPFDQRNACVVFELVSLLPTTSVLLLMSKAALPAPPSVPRSNRTPSCHSIACAIAGFGGIQ